MKADVIYVPVGPKSAQSSVGRVHSEVAMTDFGGTKGNQQVLLYHVVMWYGMIAISARHAYANLLTSSKLISKHSASPGSYNSERIKNI